MMISNCYQIMIQFVYKACNAQALIVDDNQDYSNSYDSNINIVQTQQPTGNLSLDGITDSEKSISEKSINTEGVKHQEFPYDQINPLKIHSSDSSYSGTNSTIVSTNSTSSNHILSNPSHEFNESDKQLLEDDLKRLKFEKYLGLIDQHWSQLQPFFAQNFPLYQNFFEQYFLVFHDNQCQLEDFNIKSIEKVLKKIEEQSKKEDLIESLNLYNFLDDLTELSVWGLFIDFENDKN